MKKIAVVTGSRADYGLLNPVIRKVSEDPGLSLQLMATGSHLSRLHGMTVKEIELDGFRIAAKVKLTLSDDSPEAAAFAVAEAVRGFAGEYRRLKPDIITVLGDRFEIFGAVAAAVPLSIPVAHLHGGERTLGAFDEIFRNAITQMSAIHFPATRQYAERVIRMGADPKTVFCTGSPAVDNILSARLKGREELLAGLGLGGTGEIGIMTYHPVTMKKDGGLADLDSLLGHISGLKDIYWVITMPNSDPGNAAIRRRIVRYLRGNPCSAKAFDSLGRINYLSLMKYARVMAGNSSSALIEAASFGLPAVNVGDRQKGRIRGANVVDVPSCSKAALNKAFGKALSVSFRRSASRADNPYGDGHAAGRIVKALKGFKV